MSQPWNRELGWSLLRPNNSNRNWLLCQMFLHGPDKKLSHYALGLPRRELKILVGLLTDHITLNRHLTVMKIQEDPLCPACGEQEETSLHFLGECYANMQLDIPSSEHTWCNLQNCIGSNHLLFCGSQEPQRGSRNLSLPGGKAFLTN